MFKKKMEWFWLKEVAWANGGLSELEFKVDLEKLSLVLGAGMTRFCSVCL